MKTIAILMLMVAASSQAMAQTQPGVEAAFLDYAQATKSYDTVKMTALMHPEALQRFRATFDAALQGPKKDQAEKELLPLFSVTSAAEFAQLSDVDAYKRLNDTIAGSAPQLVEMMAGAKFEVIGSTVKDEIVYLTYNLGLNINDQVVNTQVVQQFKMHDGKWLLMLPSTAEGSIAGIEARFK